MNERQQSRLPMRVLFSLAWRNIWRHRRRTVITLSSIAIGFGLAVLSIGIGDGSHNSMIRNAIKLGEGHLTVQPRGYLEAPANYKYIAAGGSLATQLAALQINGSVQPRISLQVLASTASNSVGAVVEGVSAADDPRTEMLRPMLLEGEWLQAGDERGLLIGYGMARKLKAKLGSKLVVMAGKQGGDSQAQLGRVRGIFDSHMDELDDFLILSDLSFARVFLEGEGAEVAQQPVTRFAIFLDNEEQLAHWKQRLQESIDQSALVALDWREMMPQLVQFIVIDDAGNYVFLLLILMLVVFGIVNTVLMSVLERTREFGLLRALGMGRYHLLWLVFCESLLLSLLAVVIGWLVGGGLHLWFSRHGIDFSAMMAEGTTIMGTFMDPVVFTELSAERVIQLTVIIFGATLASGIYPAIKAARVTPVAALRT
ncbi:MAG: ABC transporter permease [Gammaproteobacteria bacterium]|nr:ABC transporter permease [Gammaproteobacteria bacterium]